MAVRHRQRNDHALKILYLIYCLGMKREQPKHIAFVLSGRICSLLLVNTMHVNLNDIDIILTVLCVKSNWRRVTYDFGDEL